MSKRIFLSFVGLVFLAGALKNQAAAQQYSGPLSSEQLYERLETQDSRIRDLESRLERGATPIRLLPAVMETRSDVLGRLEALEAANEKIDLLQDEGVDTHGEKWTTKWGGRIMGDFVAWADQDPRVGGQNYFEFRRIRLFAQGTGYGVFDYKLQFDLEPENTVRNVSGVVLNRLGGTGMKDLYVGVHDIPALGYVRLGHFKAPFSLEELGSSKYITFLERSLPNVFAPMREVGVAAYNHTEDESVTWAYGAFFDSISEVTKERIDNNQGVRVVGRTTWTPYYDEMAQGRYLFHTGFGASYTKINNDILLFAARPEVHESAVLVSNGILNGADDYTVLDAEFAWVHGPLSVQSELMWAHVDGASTTDPGAGPVAVGSKFDYYGAYAYASYFFTGENRNYNRTGGVFDRVTPLENFWTVRTSEGHCWGRGAWEGAVRWSYLDLSDSLPQEELHDLTVGVNWYWNPYTRMMFNWIHAFTKSPGTRGDADILSMRMQIDF